jgi:hypothetical protein
MGRNDKGRNDKGRNEKGRNDKMSSHLKSKATAMMIVIDVQTT